MRQIDIQAGKILCLTQELDDANARIAELEAAQRWHPASEPPESNSSLMCSRDVIVRYVMGTDDDGEIYDYTVGYYSWPFSVGGFNLDGNVWIIRRDDSDIEDGIITHWCDLPPLS